jgi:hypothetical protein
MFAVAPASYQLYALYSLVFSRLAPHSEAPVETLRELGLNDSDMEYLNTDSYTPGAPIYTALWAEDFLRRTSFGNVLVYYLKYPIVPLREMYRELNTNTPVIRPPDMPNYREQDRPPLTMATRFSLWSNLRSGALGIFPYHLLLIYFAPWAAWLAGWRPGWRLSQRRLQWRFMPLALALSAAGLLAFPMATLTDALDTARHLFLFHVITELLLVVIAAAVLDLMSPEQAEERRPVALHEAAPARRLTPAG